MDTLDLESGPIPLTSFLPASCDSYIHVRILHPPRGPNDILIIDYRRLLSVNLVAIPNSIWHHASDYWFHCMNDKTGAIELKLEICEPAPRSRFQDGLSSQRSWEGWKS